MPRPTRTPKELIREQRIAEHFARVAEAEAPVDAIEAVEAELEKPGNRGLAGAAAAAKRRALAEGHAPNERAARAVERAVEKRAEARARAEARDAGLEEWKAYKAEQRAERARSQAIQIARRWNAGQGRYREGDDGRVRVIRQVDQHTAPEHQEAVLAELYGQDVADAYASGGVDAAVAALPKVW